MNLIHYKYNICSSQCHHLRSFTKHTCYLEYTLVFHRPKELKKASLRSEHTLQFISFFTSPVEQYSWAVQVRLFGCKTSSIHCSITPPIRTMQKCHIQKQTSSDYNFFLVLEGWRSVCSLSVRTIFQLISGCQGSISHGLQHRIALLLQNSPLWPRPYFDPRIQTISYHWVTQVMFKTPIC